MVLSWLIAWLSLTAGANDSRPDLLEMAATQGIREVSTASNKMFLYTFTRHGQFHKTLVLTAGTMFQTGVIKPGRAGCVSLLAAMPFNLGDGAGLTIWLTNEIRRTEALRLYLDPAHVRAHRAWIPIRFEIPPDIDHFVLQFDVNAGPRGDYTGDWIGLAAGGEAGCLLSE